MPSYDISYTYDGVGNRLTQTDNLTSGVTTYAYDAANRLLTEVNAGGTTTYSYDADGNRTKKEAPAATTFYSWNEHNHMIEAEPPSGKVTMTYNADGNRVKKETPTETKKYIYDFEKLLQETDGNDDTNVLYTATLEEYGDLVSEFDGSASSYHQYDALGSTDALLDDSETVTDRYKYRAFGIEDHVSGSSDSPFTFVGRQNYYRESELDLYLAGLRHYDPAIGQWVSDDPIRFEAGDVNLRRYVGNDATNGVDPSGRFIVFDDATYGGKGEALRAAQAFAEEIGKLDGEARIIRHDVDPKSNPKGDSVHSWNVMIGPDHFSAIFGYAKKHFPIKTPVYCGDITELDKETLAYLQRRNRFLEAAGLFHSNVFADINGNKVEGFRYTELTNKLLSQERKRARANGYKWWFQLDIGGVDFVSGVNFNIASHHFDKPIPNLYLRLGKDTSLPYNMGFDQVSCQNTPISNATAALIASSVRRQSETREIVITTVDSKYGRGLINKVKNALNKRKVGFTTTERVDGLRLTIFIKLDPLED